MEFIHGRPPLGDIFAPPRQALNEENEYLTKVGLIILIRGFPTPELPQLISARMAAIHGGHHADYAVSQATITPYIITCPNSQIRDAVVQGGIYSIPQTQICFTVHEWRPRFGMGYDPPTHQVWIRIMGLPLQAWTISEVTSFVKNFGFPLQILPFGREAGHYRDITVLIASRHPSNIPLAYRYREGDYSAQVDILLLIWRNWEDTHFPLPPDPNGHGDPPFQPQQPHQRNDPTVSAHHSSSSSSNNAPSEPTIDYSSWSPRSYRLGLPLLSKWVPKLLNSHPQANPKRLQLNLPLPSAGKSSDNPMVKKLRPSHQVSATENPEKVADLHVFRCLSSLLQTHYLSFLNPIPINPTSSLRTRYCDGHVLGGARKKSAMTLSHTVLPVPPRPSNTLTLEVMYSSPTQIASHKYLKEKTNLDLGPFKPIKYTALLKVFLTCQTGPSAGAPLLSPAQSFTPVPPLLPDGPQLFSPLPPDGPQLLFPLPPDGLQLFPPFLFSEAPTRAYLTGPPREKKKIHLLDLKTTAEDDALIPTPSKKISLISAPLSPTQISVTDTTLQSGSQFGAKTQIAAAAGMRRKKKGQLPTRRSERLQARHQTNYTDTSLLTGTKAKLAKIPFDLETSLTSLDASMTLQILQTTGLKIDSQIEQMIQDAIEQDKMTDDMIPTEPSTPLHDQTPPLAIPGTDILL